MTHDTKNENTEQEVLQTEDTVPATEWSFQVNSDDEVTRLREALARAQADYQNLLMRVDRDKADMVHFLSAKILTPLLTQNHRVYDDQQGTVCYYKDGMYYERNDYFYLLNQFNNYLFWYRYNFARCNILQLFFR